MTFGETTSLQLHGGPYSQGCTRSASQFRINELDAEPDGRVTVPVLWDTVTRRMVTNSDDDLMRMFNSEFDRFTDCTLDLYPEKLRKEIDELNQFIYERINDGVYRAGFATSQPVYEQAVTRLFDALDQLLEKEKQRTKGEIE